MDEGSSGTRNELDAHIHHAAARSHGVLTREELYRLGCSKKALFRRADIGSLIPIYPKVFRVASVRATSVQQLYAACRWLGPAAVASHRSAAVMWGLGDVSSTCRPEVTLVGVDRKSARGVIVHRTKELPSRDRRVRNLVPVTDPTRTTIDCCAVLSRLAAQAVMDDALHLRLTSLDRLLQRIDELGERGRSGIATARSLLRQRIREQERPESRLTRKLLRIIQASHLPNPVSLHAIKLPNGRVLHPDLAYPDLLVAIEADSYQHHGHELGWRRDIERDNALQRLGWIVLRFTWEDVTTRPDHVVATICDALRRRGLAVAPF